jgi:hypothetical protein
MLRHRLRTDRPPSMIPFGSVGNNRLANFFYWVCSLVAGLEFTPDIDMCQQESTRYCGYTRYGFAPIRNAETSIAADPFDPKKPPSHTLPALAFTSRFNSAGV